MLRQIIKSASSNRRTTTSILSSQVHAAPVLITMTSRSFFWNSNGNDNGNGNSNGNGKDKGDSKGKKVEEKSKKADGNDSTGSSSSSSSNGGSSTILSSSNSSSSSSSMPARVGFGDEAPRYPHLTALPVLNRPLFPGIVTSITVTDETTVQKLEQICNNSSGGGGSGSGSGSITGGGGGAGGYIGVFLRSNTNANANANTSSEHHGGDTESDHGSGSNHGHGLILEQPELITDVKDLYNVGTFAQVTRVSRGLFDDHLNHPNHHQNDSEFNAHLDDTTSTTTSSSNTIASLSNPASVLLLAHRRIDLLSLDNIGPPIDVTVSHWEKLIYKMKHTTNNDIDIDTKTDTIKALSNEILNAIREIAQHNPLFRENVTFFPTRVDSNDPYRLADFAASLTTASAIELQAVLEDKDAESRLHKAFVLLSKERELSKLQQEISRKVEEQMTNQQRKYMLNEQLKSIKKELGMEKDDKEALIQKYRKKISEFEHVFIQATKALSENKHNNENGNGNGNKTNNNNNINNNNNTSENENLKEVMDTIESELEKLSTLEKNSSEFNVTRSYLDWLTSMPWGKISKENFDIKDARRILDRDHYGLDEVKDIILQYIAVGKLKGVIKGKILCLAGPPGVGKTSIAESIAEALGRKYYRFSVGGLSDVSEIKGHRRTYVGAMPGKIIQCLKSTGTTNPLVLIDEIDKLGSGFRGDPSAALLEVLDPSQNSSFRDHFLDVPVDISKVLFMCTANDLDNIPRPLLDRMEIVRLSGYDVPEKVQIADQYLVPKAMRESGLLVDENDNQSENENETDGKEDEEKESSIDVTVTSQQDSIPDTLKIDISAIEKLVRWYCREAGVRNLNKYIEKISRKLALQVVAEDEGTELTDKSTRKSDTWLVNDENLEEYVGKPIFTSDRLYEKDPLPHGIVMGLAWTSMGGSALYIETQAIKRGTDSEGKRKGGGMLKVTGQLGDVMKESTDIAYTVARAMLAEVDPTNSFFDDVDIHMHVPEGATPKDGPSAGITMTTAMLSLALDKPISNDLAMTGEISLTGKVLAVGGIKEKIMGARRAGIKCIVLPFGCKRDFEEMPEYLKEGLEIYFAEEYETVYDVALGKKRQEDSEIIR